MNTATDTRPELPTAYMGETEWYDDGQYDPCGLPCARDVDGAWIRHGDTIEYRPTGDTHTVKATVLHVYNPTLIYTPSSAQDRLIISPVDHPHMRYSIVAGHTRKA